MINPANTDIDIDFCDRDAALSTLDYVPASMINKNGSVSRHTSGVYFQNVPSNPLNGLCAFDYNEAERLGYFKIDFLNQSVYSEIKDETHLDTLLNTEPMWELLEEPEFVSQLMHIHAHYDVVQIIKPRSISDLALVLALIRPGKKHLLYSPRSLIEANVWIRGNDDGYVFRKAHAISYAALIVVQMNLVVERMMREIAHGDGYISI